MGAIVLGAMLLAFGIGCNNPTSPAKPGDKMKPADTAKPDTTKAK